MGFDFEHAIASEGRVWSVIQCPPHRRELGETLAPASVNRLRDRLSGMFKRAKRLGLVAANPVTDIPKLKEAGARLAFVSPVG